MHVRWWTNRFSIAHGLALVAIWLLASALDYYILRHAWDYGPTRPLACAGLALASISGPMIGGLTRHPSNCCMEFSLSLLPYSIAGLATGIGFQFSPWPANRWGVGLRLGVFVMGLLVWFGSGIISFGHALS